MASQGARADPVASREESGESVEGSVAPASAGGVEVGRKGVGADAPRPPGGAPVVGYHQSMHRSFRWLSKPKLKPKHSYLHRKMGATEFEGTLDPEIAERWWEKVSEEGYEPREITWAEFQKEFDDKYRPKMYRDKKRMEFLNLVQGDNQTVAEYELRFAALAKYAPEAIVTQEDRCYRFEQGLRPEIRKGLAVRITDFKTLVESAVRMEEAVTEEKKRLKRKKVNVYCRRIDSGPRFDGPMGFIRGSLGRSSSTMPSGGSGRGIGQSYGRDQLFHRVVLSVEDNIWGHLGTQSQSSVGSSGRGTERSRGRGRGRGTSNRDNDQAIGGGMRGPGAQITQGQTQARIYNMTREEAPASNDVISGMILIFDVEAYVSIDPGSTHSYISSKLVSKISGENSPLGYNLMVYLPVSHEAPSAMQERGTVWLAVRSKRLLPPNSNNNNPPTLAQRADRNSNTVRNSSNNSKQGVARKQ
ncbi:UNVERIFIED_CONTAM: hypothetical protein Slati_3700600 [Sesamum latifolium]|uniref:Retrotransposon gag domain-containing protein n=1 Tax=Sesamum latifolium TaxID=2727402 RepID=A0AAW2U2Q9_9LAMI